MNKYYWVPYIPLIGIIATWFIPSKYDMCIKQRKHVYLSAACQFLSASIVSAIFF